MIYSPEDIETLTTLCVGQCCSLKIEIDPDPDDADRQRIWICRVGGGVTIETWQNQKWEITSGGCYADFADTEERI